MTNEPRTATRHEARASYRSRQVARADKTRDEDSRIVSAPTRMQVEHPGRRFMCWWDWSLTINSIKGPKIRFCRRPAKGDDVGRIEVLSTGSEPVRMGRNPLEPLSAREGLLLCARSGSTLFLRRPSLAETSN